MNEKGLIEQVLRIINSNYSNIYVIDIQSDKVYSFGFTIANSLVIKETITYTDFIEVAKRFVHTEELSSYFDALSLNTLEMEAQKGNNETKVKYRKLCETGEYRWFVNIINYLPFEGRRLIFMMSEDINERLIDSEENNLRLETEVTNYKTRISKENESIGDAIYQINNLLENSKDNTIFTPRDTKQYINSIFNRVSIDHPELNQAIQNKMVETNNFVKPTILIVDDSSIIRNSLKRIFEREFNLLMAKDGNEAIDIITKNVLSNTFSDNRENIVGVLLDLIMPGSDGFAVLDFMKNFNLFSKIPVAIISGDETKETRKRVYQYDIVDMLEKPFNTENIRRRISKIINLYMSSNNLHGIIEQQNKELDNVGSMENIDGLKLIINEIVKNILNTEQSMKIKKMVRVVTLNMASKYPKYNLDAKYVDAIVNGCALYNIGAIAMDDKMVITAATIKQEIEYGINIINEVINDEYEKSIAKNIINYSCEMYNGTGYPNGVSGDNIPIEAQITNIIVKVINKEKGKSITTVIKSVVDNEKDKYNPDLLTILNDSKKELKNI